MIDIPGMQVMSHLFAPTLFPRSSYCMVYWREEDARQHAVELQEEHAYWRVVDTTRVSVQKRTVSIKDARGNVCRLTLWFVVG